MHLLREKGHQMLRMMHLKLLLRLQLMESKVEKSLVGLMKMTLMISLKMRRTTKMNRPMRNRSKAKYHKSI